MYEEDSKNTSIKGIVVKVLIVILFICLLVWIFPTKGDLDNKIDNISRNDGNNNNVNIDPLLNEIFSRNITTMKNAGRSYYYRASLPKNTGDTSKITLQQLISQNYLVEFTDRNGNKCDTTASYVQLTKTDTNKYEMKTYLQCGSEASYVIDNLGCTDLCPNQCTNTNNNNNNTNTDKDGNKDGNGSDTKDDTTDTKKFKYLYSCPSTTTYWSSWSDWSTTKVSANSNRQVETKKNSTQTKVITGYKTVSKFDHYETVYTENKKQYTSVSSIPKDILSTCDNGVQKKGSTGFYYVYTCTEKVASQVPKYSYTQEPTYGYTSNDVTLYRYRTRLTSTKSSDVWSDSENDTSLLNKGCTIRRSELVITK